MQTIKSALMTIILLENPKSVSNFKIDKVEISQSAIVKFNR